MKSRIQSVQWLPRSYGTDGRTDEQTDERTDRETDIILLCIIDIGWLIRQTKLFPGRFVSFQTCIV